MAETIPAPLAGKVAVVTGGSRGIGAGIAKTFARHGCTHIAITYLSNKDAANEILDAIREINSSIKAFAFSADVRDTECGKKVVEQALKGLETDHIDIMVSNAAVLDIDRWPPIADLDFAMWNEMLTSEAWTPLVLAREAVKHMPKGGRIIMISSGASKISCADPMIPYGVAKAAMDSVSRSLAGLYAVEYGVTVNTISVGPTRTAAFQASLDKMGDGMKTFLENLSPLKRIGEVQEVADIVAFVASPQASWVTANQIPANGGGLATLQS